eukprot:jgi/Tetstr1/449464/TSEL_036559.t1
MSNSVNSPELLAEEDATTRLQAYLERWLHDGGTYDPVRLELWRLLGPDAAEALLRKFPNVVPTPDPDLNAPGLLECWENVTHLLRVAEAEARTIPVAVDQRQEDIWTCGWRVLFFIYCLLKLKPEDERRAALLSAGTCREFSTKALESFRNNVVQQRSAQDGVIHAPTDTDIVPMDLCARVGKPEDGLRPFTPWAARRIAQVRGWKSVSMGATVALVETVLNQDPSGLVQQEAAAGKAPELAVRLVREVRMKGCTGILHAADGVFFAAGAFNTAIGNRRTSKCKRCVAVEAGQRRKSTKRLKGAGGSSSVPPAVHEGGTPMELISPSQALRARFIGNKQLQSGQPTPFKLDLSDAQKTLLEMAMECQVDMSSKQWNEMGFGIQGGRIQVKPYDREKEGKVDPWKLWHWARSAPETWVGKKQTQMKRKALFAALLELRRAFVACAEKAGELAPWFWSWPVIALLFTPALAPAQITHIHGQAPNLQAILACTCHCRPTEVYRGPEVSFTDAVKHIRYRGRENHRLTERTLAETDPGAADFITSHKNLMQPLEDLERGMGVPEENKP